MAIIQTTKTTSAGFQMVIATIVGGLGDVFDRKATAESDAKTKVVTNLGLKAIALTAGAFAIFMIVRK